MSDNFSINNSTTRICFNKILMDIFNYCLPLNKSFDLLLKLKEKYNFQKHLLFSYENIHFKSNFIYY